MTDRDTKSKIANNRLITAERYYWAADVAALIALWIVWPHLAHYQALLAAGALLFANHLLSIISNLYKRDNERDARPGFWEFWLIAGNLLSGALWGGVSALLYISLPQIVASAMLLISFLLIAGWSISNIPSTKCVHAFSLAASAPIVLALALYGTQTDIAVGLVIPLFLASLHKHSRLVSSTYRASEEQVSGLRALAENEAQRGELISQDYARLHKFLDAVPVPIIVSNQASGLLLYVNKPTLTLIGIKDLSERPGARGVDFFTVPAERDKAVQKLFKKNDRTQNAPSAAEFQLKRGDGSIFWAYYTASEIIYEGEPAIIGAITDITQRRQAEEDLRQSEQKFRLLADHANDLISIYSLEGLCLYASPSTERLLGYKPEEFVGQSIAKFAHPDDLKEIYLNNLKNMETDAPPDLCLFRVRHKAGHWEWMEGSSTIEKDPATGKYTQVSSVSRLVTERVRHEQELWEARKRAEAADRAKSDFLAHMSHEIRTPLNAVIGFSEVMRDELFGPLGSPRYLEYINDIHNSGTHLLALINDVLDISKVEAGKFDLREDRVGLDAIIDAAFRFMYERAENKRIALHSRLHVKPDIWCDQRILVQVMLNMIGNAIKFTPERGNVTVESLMDDSGNLVLTVTDTGIGIAEEDIPTVMKPFGQARANISLAAAEPGTGLGLPLSRSFIEKHGGTLVITSEVGIGTRVSITIPASRVMQPDQDGREIVSAAL